MKTLVKYFGSALILFFIVLIITQLTQFNVRSDELNNIVTTAMTNTQTVIQEQIEDKVNGTSNRRYTISNNEEYVAEFTRNLYMLKSTDSQLHIHIYGVDYEKGLLSVGVDSSFRMWNNEIKTISTRKTAVIERLATGE